MGHGYLLALLPSHTAQTVLTPGSLVSILLDAEPQCEGGIVAQA